VVTAVGLALALFLLYLAAAVSNRNARKTAARLLTASSQAVSWYLKDDARTRASALIPLSFHPAVKDGLSKSSRTENFKEIESDVKEKAKKALTSFAESMSRDEGIVFDSLWAVDAHGRVLANYNFEQGTGSDHFEMGGYSVVADALHGWIRDDAWVFNGQIYRVVATPVEVELGGAPVGAVIGAKVVDDRFAQQISEKTGAALAFYAGSTRVASGAPAEFDKSSLEVTSGDLAEVEKDPDYQEKGRTSARLLRELPGLDVTAIFARLPGEAWDAGAGYVVGHRQATVSDPFEFQDLADETDKSSVPVLWIALIGIGVALMGLIFSVLEHTVPLHRFRRAVTELGDRRSKVDVLKPSTFRGVYKKIAAHVNDGLDKVAAASGIDRGPADMERVLGPLPAQPQMSAFAVPKSTARVSQQEAATSSDPQGSIPRARRSLPKREDMPSSGNPDSMPPASAGAVAAAQAMAFPGRRPHDDEEPTMVAPRSVPPGIAMHGAPQQAQPAQPAQQAGPQHHPAPHAGGNGGEVYEDEETQWRRVYQEFVALKRRLGEPTQKLTYEKFRGTLQRNKDALMQRHQCERVKFRVYEKQGRAALKASPVK
jgi:hypothetical protein